MKELKDYIHLYIGCKVQWTRSDGQLVTQELTLSDASWLRERKDAKLILRPLSELKGDDINLGDFIPEFEIIIRHFTNGYCIEIDSIHTDGYFLTVYPDGSMYCICKDNGENYPYEGGELFTQLLKKGFDLFGLKEAGLAVYETEIKK